VEWVSGGAPAQEGCRESLKPTGREKRGKSELGYEDSSRGGTTLGALGQGRGYEVIPQAGTAAIGEEGPCRGPIYGWARRTKTRRYTQAKVQEGGRGGGVYRLGVLLRGLRRRGKKKG